MTGSSPSIFFEVLTSGVRGYYAVNGSSLGAWTPIATVSTDLRTVAYADFTGDNVSDLLFENARDGSRWVLQLSATDVAIAWRPVNTVPTEWHIAGSASLSNGTTADILWQNTVTGEIGLYRMNRTTVLGWVSIGRVSPDLRMVTAGDFTGDGKPDLVFENLNDGTRWVLQMNGTTAVAWVPIGRVPTDLRIGAAGDFTGDGQLDLVFENIRDGGRWILRMTGATAQAWIALGSLPTSWHITGTRNPVSVAVARIDLIPLTLAVNAQGTWYLQAIPRDAAGTDLSGRETVTWTSSDVTKATVDAAGLVRGVSAGTLTVTASAGGKSATANVIVNPKIFPGVFIATPNAIGMVVGEACSLSIGAFDAQANVLDVRVPITISPSQGVVSVAPDPLGNRYVRVTAIGAGTAIITGSYAGQSASAVIDVYAAGDGICTPPSPR